MKTFEIAAGILAASALAACAFQPSEADKYGADESAITAEAYVSSSRGDDANDGSRDRPFKTFAKIPKKDARIFLRKGDVFYEPLSGLENCVVDSYGRGKKPLVCGIKYLKNPSAWEDMGGGVWRLDMNKTENFGGRNPQVSGQTKLVNNLGAIYDSATDTVHGHKVKKLDMFKDDWDFFAGEEYESKKINAESFRWLYVKLGRNPSSDGAELGIVTYGNGISGLKNCTVRNVAIKGFGRHGLTGCRGGRIENLDIDLIGGSTQPGYRTWVRLGNGIEFWITGSPESSGNHNYVSGCTISRTYDCGSTIQGSTEKGEIVARDITFTGNKYYRCRQAFEHFLTNRAGGKSAYEDCRFVGNFAWESGNNEFSTPEPRDNNFLTYDRYRKGMVIRNNVCYGSGIYAGTRGWATDFGDNVFYVEQGKHNLLFVYPWDNRGLTIPANGEADIKKYRETLGDETSKIIIVPESEAGAARGELLGGDFKYVRKFLRKKGR